mmetsp:Transcript_16097/g.49184  ORF Transcript_16097/g.49184 Transcript_16097/m.49184 type:complete len:247 (-) Transcript_16097:260-1000(-)
MQASADPSDWMQLTGAVPTELAQMKSLQLLTLSESRIGGTIPTELAAYTGLYLSITVGHTSLCGDFDFPNGNGNIYDDLKSLNVITLPQCSSPSPPPAAPPPAASPPAAPPPGDNCLHMDEIHHKYGAACGQCVAHRCNVNSTANCWAHGNYHDDHCDHLHCMCACCHLQCFMPPFCDGNANALEIESLPTSTSAVDTHAGASQHAHQTGALGAIMSAMVAVAAACMLIKQLGRLSLSPGATRTML